MPATGVTCAAFANARHARTATPACPHAGHLLRSSPRSAHSPFCDPTNSRAMLVPLRRQTLGREDIGQHTPEASSGRRKARPRQFPCARAGAGLRRRPRRGSRLLRGNPGITGLRRPREPKEAGSRLARESREVSWRASGGTSRRSVLCRTRSSLSAQRVGASTRRFGLRTEDRLRLCSRMPSLRIRRLIDPRIRGPRPPESCSPTTTGWCVGACGWRWRASGIWRWSRRPTIC